MLAWKKWLAVGAKFALALALVGPGAGWLWMNRQPAVPARARFAVDDPRIGILGRGWNDVMQRAALVRQRFPRTPADTDMRVVALREENKSLFRDRMGLSWGLRKLGEEESMRNILPAYLTSGLDTLLAFTPAQRAFVFDLAQHFVPEGTTQDDVRVVLEAGKPAFAAGVHQVLSVRQRWRFDKVCGPNGEFLLIDRTSYGRAPGWLAWQDWLGGGAIMTPAEAMEAVPPQLW